MKKVLFISYTNMFGGAEAVLCDYLKNNTAHEKYIYTSNCKNIVSEYKKYFMPYNMYTSDKMNIVSIKKHPIISMLNIFYNIYRIHQIVKMHAVDILYGNNTLDIVLIVLYKKYINKKIIIISHVHDILERKLYIDFIKYHKKYIEQFIVPSDATKKSLGLCNVESWKMNVVYNGMLNYCNQTDKDKDFIRKKYSVSEGKKLVCFIGQICKRKRPDLFIDIINNLNKETEKYIGILIGPITEQEYYDRIKGTFTRNIKYIGSMQRKDILETIYPGIDALILTSDRDPLPTVLLEAMSQRVIVIARDVDGVSEIVTDKIDGYLFPYNFNSESVAKTIDEIFQASEDERAYIKNNAINKINDKFNPLKKKKIINDIIASCSLLNEGG